MSKSQKKSLAAAVVSFLLGMLGGSLFSRDSGASAQSVRDVQLGQTQKQSKNHIQTARGIVSAPAKKTQAAGRPETPEMVAIPVRYAKSLLQCPLDAGLQPKSNSLSAMGVGPSHQPQIKAAFAEFVSILEQIECENKKLVSNSVGEHYEINPFELPPGNFTKLKAALYSILGDNDWRANLLLTALNDSPFAGGLGRFRQELAIETDKDTSGGISDMIKSKSFDVQGNEIGGTSFQVQSPLPRYHLIFQELDTPPVK